MNGIRPTVLLTFAAFWSGSLDAQQADLNYPVRTVVTSGAEDRNQLASELVAMLFVADNAQEVRPIGAATVIGLNRECLYLATADHVARDATGKARALLARMRWREGDPIPVKVLDPQDAAADLGVLCLADPEHLFVPFPRIPFFTSGQPARLVSGEPMTFYGHGSTIDWHTKSEAMTYASTSADVLTVRGGGIEPGDSGGGLFRQDAVFNELVGIILRTSIGETQALSIDRVTQRFRDWKLPVNLEGWNFREANSVANTENDQGSLQVGMVSPPNVDRNIDRLKRLAIEVSGGPSGRRTGLLIGATESSVWVQVPWGVSDQGPAPRIRFASGFETSATYLPSTATADESMLKADLPHKELENLALASAPAILVIGNALPFSPLRIPFLPSSALTDGTTAFLVGVDSAGHWQISPRDLNIQRSDDQRIISGGGAINPLSIGWLAFDDRNRLIGTVAAVHNTTLDLSPIRDLAGTPFLPETAARLRRWHTLNVSTQVLAGGADPHCAVAQAIGYGRIEEADDVTLTPKGLVIAGRTRMWDTKEMEDFTLRLDRWPNIVEAGRSRVPGQKGTQRLITDADQRHTFVIGQVLVSPDAKNASAEPVWCGFVDEVSSTGVPRLPAPFQFCGASSQFLPEVALASLNGAMIFAGGKAEKNQIVTAAALGSVTMDGSVRGLFEDRTSIRLGAATHAKDGSIYIVGYGTIPVTDSHPIVLTKLAPDGTILWSATQTDSKDQIVRAMATMTDGSPIVVGYASSVDDPNTRILRIWEFSTGGRLLWKRDFNLGVNTDISDVVTDGDRAVLVGEVSWPDSVGNVSVDGWILAVDPNGKLDWQQTYSSKYALHRRFTRFRRVLRTPGGYIVLGEIGTSGLGGNVLWLVRLQPDGLAVPCKP